MILDKLTEFSDAQALTTTAFGTNVIDLGVAGRSFGEVKHLDVVFQVDVALASGTSVACEIVTSANADLSSPTLVGTSGAIITASLTAATTVAVLPLPRADLSRYLGVRYTIVGAYDAGTISAFLTPDAQTYKSYANGSDIAANA